MKIIFLMIPFLCFSDMISSKLEWKADKGVKVIDHTQLGSLYYFSGTENNTFLSPSYLQCRTQQKNCECDICKTKKQIVDGGVVEIQLPKANKKQKKRFFAIDFMIRAYPAFSEKKNPHLQFLFMDSEKKISMSRYSDLHGMLNVNNMIGEKSYTTPREVSHSSANAHLLYSPSFEPQSIRIIYDLKDAKWAFCLNGKDYPFYKMHKIRQSNNRIDITHLGISVPSENRSPFRTQYLELSSPTLHLFDHESEIKNLPKLKFTPYGYNNYGFDKKNKKPDVLYANALQILYGDHSEYDPEEGVNLLEKAAQKKHVLALYELGVCHFRGYGVPVNFNKAKKYLGDSGKYKYSRASALNWFMDFENKGYPWFDIKEMDASRKKIKGDSIFEHDRAFTYIFDQIPMTPMVSEKLLLEPDIAKLFNKNDFSLKFVDYIIQKKGVPGYLEKVLLFSELTKKETIENLSAAVKMNDDSAYPELLYFLYKENGVFPKNAFSNENRLKYRDSLLYQILYIAEKRPGLIGFSDFFKKNRFDLSPIAAWQNAKNPEKQFLFAAAEMFFLQYVRYRKGNDDEIKKRLEIAFYELEKSANGKYPAAEYFFGRFFYYNDLPEKYQKRYQNLYSRYAEEWLLKAYRSGYIGSEILYIKQALTRKTIKGKDFLEMLAFGDKVANPDSIYMIAEVYSRMGQEKEAKLFFTRAAEKGIASGWLNLALACPKKSNVRASYWQRYIREDRHNRASNRFDPFCFNRFAEYSKWGDTDILFQN